jgi:hypothetical protein
MPPPTHPSATLADARQLAVTYIKNADPDIMAAIAMAESGGKYRALNRNTNGSTDKGLWQINSIHGLEGKGYNLYDPEDNAKAASVVYDKQGYKAWAVYNSGAYKKYAPENVYPTGVGTTGFKVDGVTSSIGNAVNAATETVTRVGLSAGALTVALTLLVLGVVILMRSSLSKAASVAGVGNPVGKTLSKVSKVVT